MQHTIFIADLHLHPDKPAITAKFLEFLQTHAANADALYILGDFFELWVGDDEVSEFNTQIKTALKNYSEKVPLFYLPGNHDFLVGEKFMQEAGSEIIPDPSRVDIYNVPVVLTHGDLLCGYDLMHMAFRQLYLNKFFQKIFLMLSPKVRRTIGNLFRKKYRGPCVIPKAIRNYCLRAAQKMLMKYDGQVLVHGHIHCPEKFDFSLNGKPASRIILGDWLNGSAKALFIYKNGSLEFKQNL